MLTICCLDASAPFRNLGLSNSVGGTSIWKRWASTGLRIGEQKRHKVAYSEEVVDLLDLAAKIARASESPAVRVQDLLVSYASHDGGLMGQLKSQFRFTSAQWRAAVAAIGPAVQESSAFPLEEKAIQTLEREYLTPEEAAEIFVDSCADAARPRPIRKASCLATGW